MQDEYFVWELKKYIKEFKTQDTENVLDEQIKWDFLKYEIRKFFIAFSNSRQKEKVHKLENKIKVLETKLQNDKNIKLHNRHKQELDEIFDNIAEGIRIRSRCQWYEKGEKSNKFFLNLEKKCGVQGHF